MTCRNGNFCDVSGGLCPKKCEGGCDLFVTYRREEGCDLRVGGSVLLLIQFFLLINKQLVLKLLDCLVKEKNN